MVVKGDPGPWVNCPVCGAAVRARTLAAHAKKWHPGKQWLPPREREVIRYGVRREREPGRVRCPSCNKLVTAAGLDSHMRAKHGSTAQKAPPVPPQARAVAASRPAVPGRPIAAEKPAAVDKPSPGAKPVTRRVRCRKCGKKVRPQALGRHMARHRYEARRQAENARKAMRRVQEGSPEPAEDTVTLFPEPRPVVLYSRRGMRVDAKQHCAECGSTWQPVWRYARSNQGAVYLCARCKVVVSDRSFGGVDALDVSVSGGGFDTNPRRH